MAHCSTILQGSSIRFDGGFAFLGFVLSLLSGVRFVRTVFRFFCRATDLVLAMRRCAMPGSIRDSLDEQISDSAGHDGSILAGLYFASLLFSGVFSSLQVFGLVRAGLCGGVVQIVDNNFSVC